MAEDERQEALVYQSELFVGPPPYPEHLLRNTSGSARGLLNGSFGWPRTKRLTVARWNRKSSIPTCGWRHAGQILAFAIVVTALIGGIGLMAFDKSVSGAATSITAIATLAGIFVWSKRQKRKDLKEKTHPTAIDTRSAPPPMPPGLQAGTEQT